MTPQEQHETIAKSLHAAHDAWHLHRYGLPARTWEQLGAIERGLYLYMAVDTFDAVLVMVHEEEEAQAT